MNPPERAAVFCFDEKTQCQALDRTQPSLPMKPGRGGTRTHDYKRNGTTDLFAAMNVATGEVLYDCRRRHKGKDVLSFFRLLDAHVPRDLEVHVVLDNLSAHMGPEVTTWLDHPKRARWHLHFTPTSSSWLNLVERWFKELTDRRLRRGAFSSVNELIDAIELWAEHWNDDPKPFVWHATAAEIIERSAADGLRLPKSNPRRSTRRLPEPDRQLGCRWQAPPDRASASEPGRDGGARRSRWVFEGRAYDQEEMYFLVRVSGESPTDGRWSEVEKATIVGHRWWTVEELSCTDETVYRVGLAGILERFL